MSLEKILFVPDTHRPYHDKKAWSLMMKAAKDFKPDHVIVLGDFFDFYPVSSHPKSPDRKINLKQEIEDGLKGLDELGALGAKSNVFIEGNHENRLVRFIEEKQTTADIDQLFEAGVFSKIKLENIFNSRLKADWKFVPYKNYYKIGKLHITHDLGKAGPSAVRDAEATFQSNAVIGHIHSINYHVKGNMKGSVHVGASFGWLGDVDSVDYMHKGRAVRDWALGFGVGYKDSTNNYVYLQPVPIINYTCLINGKVFKV